ncbi:endodeoxyribonuclease [Gryganskiella cystojenkinii]|nr:endodeoxyribonuclease [Gryganskiella cystojenkinii]
MFPRNAACATSESPIHTDEFDVAYFDEPIRITAATDSGIASSFLRQHLLCHHPTGATSNIIVNNLNICCAAPSSDIDILLYSDDDDLEEEDTRATPEPAGDLSRALDRGGVFYERHAFQDDNKDSNVINIDEYVDFYTAESMHDPRILDQQDLHRQSITGQEEESLEQLVPVSSSADDLICSGDWMTQEVILKQGYDNSDDINARSNSCSATRPSVWSDALLSSTPAQSRHQNQPPDQQKEQSLFSDDPRCLSPFEDIMRMDGNFEMDLDLPRDQVGSMKVNSTAFSDTAPTIFPEICENSFQTTRNADLSRIMDPPQPDPELFMSTRLRSREWILGGLERMAAVLLEDMSLQVPPKIIMSARSKPVTIGYDESTGIIRRKKLASSIKRSHCKQPTNGARSQAQQLSTRTPSKAMNKMSWYGYKASGVFEKNVRVLELIHENVLRGTISSKRDLYYKDVLLFQSQRTVDLMVEDMACTLQVPRSSLNVVAGCRSIIYGSVRLSIKSGKISLSNANPETSDIPTWLQQDIRRSQEASSSSSPFPLSNGSRVPQTTRHLANDEGDNDNCDGPLENSVSRTDYNTLVMIPVAMEDILDIEIHPRTKFVLVIEKEATMQHLISIGFCDILGPCILLTSKGYPDQVARLLLGRLAEMIKAGVWVLSDMSPSRSPPEPPGGVLSKSLSIPILALVDCDPNGIEIYLTYRCGSIQSAYDNANLALPSIQCLGQVPSDWKEALAGSTGEFGTGSKLSSSSSNSLQEQFRRALVPLTRRDRSKLIKFLTQHPYIKRHSQWRKEVSKMLHLNCKTELQSLCVGDFVGSTMGGSRPVSGQGSNTPALKPSILDPWAKHHAWRNHALFTRSTRIGTMFPGLGIATVAFAAYLGYEYVTAPKADAHAHHGEAHH